jgi:riboflavin synthase
MGTINRSTCIAPQARAQQQRTTTTTTPHRRSPTPARRARLSTVRVAAVFTGIVQGKARVAAVESRPGFTHMTIEFPAGMADSARMGASVAINGTCLTVVEETAQAGDDRLAFDLIAETLRATALGELEAGDEVNFERAAKVGDEIGGHNVSGHVHTTAQVVAVEETPDNRRVVFRVEQNAEKWMRYILPKGFVAVDGCSLTVGEVEGDTFSVYLIPETLRVTTLGQRAPAAAGGGDGKKGGRCNIEVEAQTQAVVDTVERVLGDYVNKAVKGGGGPLAEAVRAVVGR